MLQVENAKRRSVQAQTFLNNGRFNLARSELDAATKLAPDLGEALFVKAELYLATCHFEEAAEYYEKALEAGIGSPELHQHWRHAIEQAGKDNGAILQYQRAIGRHGDDQGAGYLWLGNCLLSAGLPEASVPEYQAALKHPEHAESAGTKLVELQIRDADFDSAETTLRRVIKAQPSIVDPFFAWSNAAVNSDDPAAGLRRLHRFVKQTGRPPSGYLALAQAFLELKRLRRARAALNEAERHGAGYKDLWRQWQKLMPSGPTEELDDCTLAHIRGFLERSVEPDALRRLGEFYDYLKRPVEAKSAYGRAVARLPSDASLHVAYYKFLTQHGDQSEALEELADALRSVREMNRNEILWEWGFTYLTAESATDESIEKFRQAVAGVYKGAATHLALAEGFSAAERWRDAAYEYGTAVSKDAGCLLAYNGWLNALKNLDDSDSFDNEMARATLLWRKTPQRSLTLGRLYQHRGKLVKAINEFESTVAQAPELKDGYQDWLTALQAVDDLATAELAHARADALWPDTQRKHLAFGKLWLSFNKIAAAKAAFDRAVAKEPDNVGTLVEWAHSLQESGSLEAAAEIYFQALSLHNQCAPALQAIPEIIRSLEMPETFLKQYRKYIERDNFSSSNIWTLAGLLHNLGYFQDASNVYEHLITRNDPLQDDALLNQANIASTFRNFELGHALFAKLIRRKPDNALYRLHRGIFLQRSGDAAGAVTAFEDILQQNPTNGDALVALCNALIDLREYERAFQSYQDYAKARSFAGNSDVGSYDGSRGLALHNVAFALHRMGQYEKSRSYWNHAISDYTKEVDNIEAPISEPNSVWSLKAYNVGMIYQFIVGNLTKAEKYYKLSLQFDHQQFATFPNLIALYKDRADSLRRQQSPGAQESDASRLDVERLAAAFTAKARSTFFRGHRAVKSALDRAETAELHALMAELLLADEQPKNALEHAKRAVELSDGKYIAALVLLADIHVRRSEYADAVECYEAVLAKDSSFDIRSRHANALLKSSVEPESAERARRELHQLRDRVPGHVEATMFLAEVYATVGNDFLKNDNKGEAGLQFSRAVSLLTEILEPREDRSRPLKPKDLDRVRYLRGQLLANLHELGSTLALTKEAIKYESRIERFFNWLTKKDNLRVAYRDLRSVSRGSGNSWRAQEIARRIKRQLTPGTSPQFFERVSQFFLVMVALMIFGVAQYDFFFRPKEIKFAALHFEKAGITEFVNTLPVDPDWAGKLRGWAMKLPGREFESGFAVRLDLEKAMGGQELPQLLTTGAGSQPFETVFDRLVAASRQKTVTAALARFDVMGYLTASFGAIILMFAGLSLPQLLRLKIGAFELERASTEDTLELEPLGGIDLGQPTPWGMISSGK